ncbi:MAG: dependent protein [Actinomycetota bacterium]|nr:dependent protein [Actinomycetota bacterium]
MTLQERLDEVRARIRDACASSGRTPDEVTLVGVAKTFSVDVVAAGLDAGLADIGENRAQELKEKAAVLGREVRWHFIGPLQTNKVRHVVGTALMIHSVDRFGLGEAIARRADALGIRQQVLIEVNIGGEAAKTGIEPQRAGALASELAALRGLEVAGLMTIPPRTSSPEEARPYFRHLAELREEVAGSLPGVAHLSMGMTSDFTVAIEEGATLVRVGRAIFGPRSR